MPAPRRSADDGATAVEYALLAALVAVILVASVTLLGGGVGALVDEVAALLGGGVARP
jgi:pilus assembly protein Flp/PilA